MRRVEFAHALAREYAHKFEKFVNLISRLWSKELPPEQQHNANRDELKDLGEKIVQKRLTQDGYVVVRSGEHNTPADLWVLNPETNELTLMEIQIATHAEYIADEDLRGLCELKSLIGEYNSCGFEKINSYIVGVTLHRTGAPTISYKKI